jgi:N-acetylglutamate synthase-like GNAT family acetyltransferase
MRSNGITVIEIEPATLVDKQSIHALLTDCDLSTLEVLEPGTMYFVARLGEKVIGVCGVEFDGESALLRSVAVDNGTRGQGIARALIGGAIQALHRRGVRALFLFSKDTGAYFENLGWVEVPVSEAADALRQAPQVKRYDRMGWYVNERAFRPHLSSD